MVEPKHFAAFRVALALCAAMTLLVPPAAAHAAIPQLNLEARFGTDLVEQGVSVTKGGPGVLLNAEYGDIEGFFAGLDAHNIDFVPNGAPDRNLFIRISPYLGWRLPVGENLRLTGIARYVWLPEAIPHNEYAVFELEAEWKQRMGFAINHSADRFGRGVATTAYELNGTLPLGHGLALRGVAGWHDFDAIGGEDYGYAGVALVASTPRFDLELAYHALDGAGDRMFEPFGGEPALVLTVIGRTGPAQDWAAAAPSWLDRVSFSGELRSQFISGGVAQTFDAPAVQLALEYALPGGTYFEVWGSNVDYTQEGEPVEGVDSEIDYTLGHRFALSRDWKMSARAAAYTYPGAEDRSEWDEIEYVLEATWRDQLRFKAGVTPNVAGNDETRLHFTARWKQPLGKGFNGSLEVGHKDRGDWGLTYNWAKAEVSRPLGKLNAILRYWTTNEGGRKANGTADPTFEFALGWGL